MDLQALIAVERAHSAARAAIPLLQGPRCGSFLSGDQEGAGKDWGGISLCATFWCVWALGGIAHADSLSGLLNYEDRDDTSNIPLHG